jgi:hypothetical protein
LELQLGDPFTSYRTAAKEHLQNNTFIAMSPAKFQRHLKNHFRSARDILSLLLLLYNMDIAACLHTILNEPAAEDALEPTFDSIGIGHGLRLTDPAVIRRLTRQVSKAYFDDSAAETGGDGENYFDALVAFVLGRVSTMWPDEVWLTDAAFPVDQEGCLCAALYDQLPGRVRKDPADEFWGCLGLNLGGDSPKSHFYKFGEVLTDFVNAHLPKGQEAFLDEIFVCIRATMRTFSFRGVPVTYYDVLGRVVSLRGGETRMVKLANMQRHWRNGRNRVSKREIKADHGELSALTDTPRIQMFPSMISYSSRAHVSGTVPDLYKPCVEPLRRRLRLHLENDTALLSWATRQDERWVLLHEYGHLQTDGLLADDFNQWPGEKHLFDLYEQLAAELAAEHAVIASLCKEATDAEWDYYRLRALISSLANLGREIDGVYYSAKHFFLLRASLASEPLIYIEDLLSNMRDFLHELEDQLDKRIRECRPRDEKEIDTAHVEIRHLDAFREQWETWLEARHTQAKDEAFDLLQSIYEAAPVKQHP